MKDKQSGEILLIDDDTSLLITLGDFLRFEGYKVVSAENGEEGLSVLENMQPDLIILDMSMPGMGGLGFLKRICGEDGKPRFPVLVLTARANMAEFFADVEVDGFVAKPCDPADLMTEVNRIVFLRRRTREATPGGAPGRPRQKKILLGEDDMPVARKIEHALVEHGYAVEIVTKGPEAVEKAIVGRPDLALLKLVFAGMNGDAVAEMLRDMPNTRGIPVVIYDDSSVGETEERHLRRGSPVRKFVRNSEPESLVEAVEAVFK